MGILYLPVQSVLLFTHLTMSSPLDYATRRVHLNAKLTRLSSQITTAQALHSNLTTQAAASRTPDKVLEGQLRSARKRIKAAEYKYERARAEFYLDAEKKNEEARLRLLEAVEKYLNEGEGELGGIGYEK